MEPSTDTSTGTSTDATPRLVGLDVLRGGMLALMLLTPVTGTDGSYPLLGHAEWDGFTVADAILPLFLVASGASLSLLLRPPVSPATRLRLVRRTLALLVLGVAYNAVGQPLDLTSVRLTGVLQMIGLSGGLAAAIVLLSRRFTTSSLPVLATAVALPLVHGLTIARTGACAGGTQRCSPLIGLERRVLGDGRLFADGAAGFDPEGFGPSVVATALVLAGVLAMQRIRLRGPKWTVLGQVAGVGVVLVLVALLVDGVQPINKRLHTPAFTLLTAGLGLLLLSLLTAMFDSDLPRRIRSAGRRVRMVLADPFTTLGRNALVVFLTERVLLVAAVQTTVSSDGQPMTLQEALVGTWFPVLGVRAHLALTGLLLLVVLGVTYVMRAMRWRIVL